MSDFYLNEGDIWDLQFDINGDLQFLNGPAEVSQNSAFRLQILAGELFEDTRQGVPWLTDMVDPRVSIDAKKQILRSTILSTPNVRSLDELRLSVEQGTGRAVGTFKGTTISNEEFSGAV